MEIKIRSKNFETTSEMKKYVEEKVSGVVKYLKNTKDAYVELEGDAHHKNGAVAHAEISLHIIGDGEVLFAEDTASDMHEALDRAVGKLKHVIERYKGTHNQIDKNALRELREGE